MNSIQKTIEDWQLTVLDISGYFWNENLGGNLLLYLKGDFGYVSLTRYILKLISGNEINKCSYLYVFFKESRTVYRA